MTTKPPPSRYKIIEKDGRLITVDTHAAGAATHVTQAPVVAPKAAPTVRPSSALSPTRPRPSTARATGQPRGAFVTIAGLFPGAEIGPDDRVILTTKAQYDDQAPRRLRLTAQKTDALGRAMIVIAVALISGVWLAASTDLFFVAIVLILFGAKIGKPFSKASMIYITNDAEVLG